MKKTLGLFCFTLSLCLTPLLSSAAPINNDSKNDEAYTAYLKALLEESRGNLSMAMTELKKAIAISPNSSYLYKTGAELAFRNAQYDEAAEMVEKALEYDPNSVKLNIMAGQIYWTKGDTAAAEVKLSKALKLAPDEAEALVSLAVAVSARDPQRAEELYENYLARHPQDFDVQERVAQLYQATGNIEKAKASWAKALELSPDSLRAHLASAQIAEVEADTMTAISHYEAVLEQDPTNLPLILRIGELRYRDNDMAKAQEAFSKAISIAPESTSANFWLALIAENKGDWNEAIRLIKLVAEKSPDPGVMLRLSFYYSQVGKKKESIQVLQKLSQAEPENIDFLNYLSLAQEQDNQFDQAIKTVEKMSSIDSDNPEHRFHLATLYDRKGNPEKAENELKKAIEMKPDYAAALNYLGYAYADRNVHLDEAEQYLNKAIILDARNPAFLDSLGWLYFRQGRLKEAEKLLRDAGNLSADSLIFSHHGDVLLAQKNTIEAIRAYDESLRLKTDQKDLIKKNRHLVEKLSDSQKGQLFVERAHHNFHAIVALHGLTEISFCEGIPCFTTKGDLSYEKGKEFRIQVPGPLGSPALLVVAKPGKKVQYGAIHPVFQSAEPEVTSAIERIHSLFAFTLFPSSSAISSSIQVEKKKSTFIVKTPKFTMEFSAPDGTLEKIIWTTTQTEDEDSLSLTWKHSEFFPAVPVEYVWKHESNKRTFKLNFKNPIVSMPRPVDDEK